MSNSNKADKAVHIEMAIMFVVAIIAFGGMAVIALNAEDMLNPSIAGLSMSKVVLVLFGFFSLGIIISIISVVAGIGGGVIFTPLMLAFTGANSVIIRGTGMLIAMFSGFVSTGIFMRNGLCNYRLCLIMTVVQGLGALAGAILAIFLSAATGLAGEGFLRISLGILLVGISIYLFTGGKKQDFPIIKHVDGFTAALKLSGSYYEASEDRTIDYKVTKSSLGMALLFFIGIVGGFFGMGGGWAITPDRKSVV